MKTTKTKSNKSELQSRPEHPITGETDNNTMQQPPAVASSSAEAASQPTRILPYVNFEQREQNRSLSTDQVLDLLRQWLPEQFNLAEIVGKWIWVTFPEPPAEKIRGQLSQFGFHWNNHRKCWQHPCGQFATEGSGADPRQKYGSRQAIAA
jgi:hypothetical protein